MCCGPRVYALYNYKRHRYKYKRHTRPRAVRTVRLRVTEWQSGQWQRNAECSRQLAQNFPKERHYRSTTHSGGGGRPLCCPRRPRRTWGGGGRPRTAEARRCGAGGSKGVTTGCGRWRVAPCARYSFRGPVAVQRADLCARRENRRSRRRDARAKAAVPAYP